MGRPDPEGTAVADMILACSYGCGAIEAHPFGVDDAADAARARLAEHERSAHPVTGFDALAHAVATELRAAEGEELAARARFMAERANGEARVRWLDLASVLEG